MGFKQCLRDHTTYWVLRAQVLQPRAKRRVSKHYFLVKVPKYYVISMRNQTKYCSRDLMQTGCGRASRYFG